MEFAWPYSQCFTQISKRLAHYVTKWVQLERLCCQRKFVYCRLELLSKSPQKVCFGGLLDIVAINAQCGTGGMTGLLACWQPLVFISWCSLSSERSLMRDSLLLHSKSHTRILSLATRNSPKKGNLSLIFLQLLLATRVSTGILHRLLIRCICSSRQQIAEDSRLCLLVKNVGSKVQLYDWQHSANSRKRVGLAHGCTHLE